MNLLKAHQIELAASEEYPAGGNLAAVLDELRADVDGFDGALAGVATEEYVNAQIAAAAPPVFSEAAPTVAGLLSPNALKTFVRDMFFPIGRVLTTTDDDEDPNVTIGGTWQVYASGLMLIGQTNAVVALNTIGNTGGAREATLTTSHLPAHNHKAGLGNGTTVSIYGGTADGVPGDATGRIGSVDPFAPTSQSLTSTEGGGQAFSILNPYVVVKRWRRTA